MGNLFNLFMDDKRMFSSRLAAKIGLNEAIFVQQLYYWLDRSDNVKDGELWVYNTAKQWQEQLPFFGVRTIERVIRSLREKGIIIVGSYNKKSFDRTNWYRLDYDRLNSIFEEIVEEERNKGILENVHSDKMADSHSDKMAVSDSDKMADSHSDKMAVSDSDKMAEPIPYNTTNNTTENTTTTTWATSSSDEDSSLVVMVEERADVEPIVLITGEEWKPSKKDYEKLCRYFPEVDIKASFRAMSSWWWSHKDGRKGEFDIMASIVSWLQKDQAEILKEQRLGKDKGAAKVQNNMDNLKALREAYS